MDKGAVFFHHSFSERGFMVSIRELARLCGVTEGTVSRALSSSEKVSEKTRRKVLEAAKKFNYNPNLLARGVFTGKTRTIGMTAYPTVDEFSVKLINGVLSELCRNDYRMMLMPWPDFSSGTPSLIRKFNEYRVDGILITPIIQRDFNEYRLELEKYYGKIMVIDQQLPSARYDFIGFDDTSGTLEAVAHLLRTGCRRIGWVCAYSCESAQRRFEAFRQAMVHHGVPLEESLVLNEPDSRENDFFQEHIRRMIQDARPDAVLAFNDNDAVSVLNIALDLGIRVPDELSIVGFGDLSHCLIVRPALSTVQQDIEGLGRIAVRKLLERIHGNAEGFIPEKTFLETRFVPRGSCRS